MLGKNAGEMLRATRVKTLADLEKFLVTHGLENYEQRNSKRQGCDILNLSPGRI